MTGRPLALSVGSGNVVVTLLGMVLAVVGILALAYLTTRWIGRRGAPGGGFTAGAGDEKLQVVRLLSVGQNERLALVRLGERCLLLGITTGQITLLRELSESEAALWLHQTEDGDPQPPSFLDVLRKNLPKGK